ncbi:MAG: hypothetical protein WDM91_23770 [Rhizomicrobium sp.]
MINRPVFACLVMLSGLCLSACHTTNDTFDPIGRWSSKEGYEVTLRTNGTYEFCDRGWCSQGKLEHPGNRGGIAVTLVDFFKKENSGRLVQELKKLYSGYNIKFGEGGQSDFGNGYDWDFTVNSGIGSASSSEFCGYKPCVLLGNLETGPNLTFTKTDF